MKFEIDSKELKRALTKINCVSKSGINLLILNGVLIEAKENKVVFSSTDLDLFIRIECDAIIAEQGACVIERSKFSKIITSLKCDKIIIEEKDKWVTINGSINLVCLGDIDDFPTTNSPDDFVFAVPDNDKFVDSVRRSAVIGGDYLNRLYTTNIQFEVLDNELKLISTDGSRLSIDKIKINYKNDLFIFYLLKKYAEKIGRLITKKEKYWLCKEGKDSNDLKNKFSINSDNESFIFSSIDLSYPKYENILDYKVNSKFKVKKEDLLSTLNPMLNYVDEGYSGVLMESNGNELIFTFTNPNLGEMRQVIKTKLENNFEAVYNLKFLLDGINNIEGGYINFEFTSDKGPLYMAGNSDQKFFNTTKDNYNYVLMPMNI